MFIERKHSQHGQVPGFLPVRRSFSSRHVQVSSPPVHVESRDSSILLAGIICRSRFQRPIAVSERKPRRLDPAGRLRSRQTSSHQSQFSASSTQNQRILWRSIELPWQPQAPGQLGSLGERHDSLAEFLLTRCFHSSDGPLLIRQKSHGNMCLVWTWGLTPPAPAVRMRDLDFMAQDFGRKYGRRGHPRRQKGRPLDRGRPIEVPHKLPDYGTRSM